MLKLIIAPSTIGVFIRIVFLLGILLSSQAIAERHIVLDGQSNFRDVGGYLTTNGKRVKWGEVYRSGELHKLSDSDVEKLDSIGIKTVASFLVEAEIEARGHDRLPDGVREVALPMEAGNLGELAAVVNEARNTGDFSQVPVELNPEIHRILIDEGREYYATLIREMANPVNRPMLYHCSHGVHRTGTATAILLSALGVPWDTVREDYLLSNVYRKEEIDRRIGELQLSAASTFNVDPEQIDMTNIRAFYILQPEYIDASLIQAEKKYGSMENYIRKGLGISDKELEALRNQLLESVE